MPLVLGAALLVLLCAGVAEVGEMRGEQQANINASATTGESQASTDESASSEQEQAEPPLSSTEGVGAAASTDSQTALPLDPSKVTAPPQVRETALDVVASAAAELERYRSLENVVLVRAGWLDLLGNTWGCVVSGPGWVELCVVSELEPDTSQVKIVRMEAEQWGRAYADG